MRRRDKSWRDRSGEYNTLQRDVVVLGKEMDKHAERLWSAQAEVSRLTKAAMLLPLYLEPELEKATQNLADLTDRLADVRGKYEEACVAYQAASAAWNEMRKRLLREERIAEAAAQTRLARWVRQKLAARQAAAAKAAASSAGAGGAAPDAP